MIEPNVVAPASPAEACAGSASAETMRQKAMETANVVGKSCAMAGDKRGAQVASLIMAMIHALPSDFGSTAQPTPEHGLREAAGVILANPAAVMALARAYDAEDSAQRGEPDPHGPMFEDETFRDEWESERRACAERGLRAVAALRAQIGDDLMEANA